VSLHSTLAELGMDSMMAVEIKQTLEREFEVFLTPQDIRSMTFAKLYEISSTTDAPTKKIVEEKGLLIYVTDAASPYLNLPYLYNDNDCTIRSMFINIIKRIQI
jgi:fatty acid synthase